MHPTHHHAYTTQEELAFSQSGVADIPDGMIYTPRPFPIRYVSVSHMTASFSSFLRLRVLHGTFAMYEALVGLIIHICPNTLFTSDARVA